MFKFIHPLVISSGHWQLGPAVGSNHHCWYIALKNKCLKALNLLRVVANTKWGSDEKTLLHLYRSLIWSKLEYGAVVYGSARKSYLRMLDPVQNQALRTCLGAFRTFPVTSLHVEANEMPLDLRCRMLSSEYCLRVSSNAYNPVRSCIFSSRFTKFFDNKKLSYCRGTARQLHTSFSANSLIVHFTEHRICFTTI